MNASELHHELLTAVHNEELVEILITQINEIDKAASSVGDAALDPNIGGGGQAFLWEDLLSLEDVTGLLVSLPNLPDLKTQAEILVKLVLFWRKLRGVRVALDREQYQVMKAVKGGANSVDQVAARLGMNKNDVRRVVDGLTIKKYREGVMLLKETDGDLSTDF